MSGGLASTLNMSAGTYIDITVPVDKATGQGQFPLNKEQTITLNGKTRTHVLGFISENEVVGIVEEQPGLDTLTVKYSHLKNETNRIFYYTANMEVYTIAIIAMPLHDHSSIAQGGPAFGTYYYDKPTEPQTSN